MRTNARWLVIGLVFTVTLINYLDRLTVSVLAPVIMDALRLSNLEYASVGTWFLLAYTISQTLSGRLYDRIGTRRGFMVSVIVWSLAAIGHAFTRGLGGLSAWRFVLGLGEAGNWPGAAKVVAEWFPVRERAFAMGIFNSGAAIGSIVAPPLIVGLQLAYGWQATFVITGGLGFAWFIAWSLLYRPTAREHDPAQLQAKPRVNWMALLRRREVWAIVLTRFLVDPVWWLYISWLPLFLYRVHGFDLKKIGLFAWVPYVAADAGSLLGGFASGYLVKRGWSVRNARRASIGAAAALMPAGILAARAESPFTALALIGLVLFGFQFWINNVQTLPSDWFPSDTVASVAGLGGTGAGIGSMIFLLLTGWVVDHAGYTPILTAAGVLAPAGTLVLFALFPNATLDGLPRPGESVAVEQRQRDDPGEAGALVRHSRKDRRA
ncbi:MFS transporter [Pendulispora brunnea]|uniref:MFS transporter n=1 Tax=Pendulispora brunnea TaxID=2905690 RepID=A0ABZ2KM32_9BACT